MYVFFLEDLDLAMLQITCSLVLLFCGATGASMLYLNICGL